MNEMKLLWSCSEFSAALGLNGTVQALVHLVTQAPQRLEP